MLGRVVPLCDLDCLQYASGLQLASLIACKLVCCWGVLHRYGCAHGYAHAHALQSESELKDGRDRGEEPA